MRALRSGSWCLIMLSSAIWGACSSSSGKGPVEKDIGDSTES